MKDACVVLHELERYALTHRIPILQGENRELLARLVKESKPRIILEIGTAIGYSTLLLALNMPEGATIITIEKDAGRAVLAKEAIATTQYATQIQVVVGDAGQILPNLLLLNTIDMVFIDAAKAHYLDYLSKIIGQLSPTAVVVADNVLFRGMVEGRVAPLKRYRTIVKRLQEYLRFVTTDPRFQTVLERSGDGMSISYYRGDIEHEET